ncbi:MAG: ShlB/FhaC/HecB family hemolysin secretion/activation protein [Candidatus Omnitrophica bacterium]|nr:ShlB/FhaC/HecB family hemolysin secretion/activation protein [Candidatus Omnitrophota bacterium]
MNIRSCRTVLFFLIITVLCNFSNVSTSVFAQVPPGKDIGTLERDIKDTKEKELLKKRLEVEKEQVPIEGEGAKPQVPTEVPKIAETKVLINKIIVTGVAIFGDKKIRPLVAQYEGKELSLEDFSAIADLITAEYRKNGYVTSFAYIPPQKVVDNTLEIAVSEGMVGNIEIDGNKNFKKELLMRYIELETGEIFNYDELRKNVNYINEHPDRNANVVLSRGAGPRETDVNINVKDRLPIHAILGYNNYNSRYVDRNKYFAELKFNNIFGLDHVASCEIQQGHTDKFHLYGARYTMPINSKNKLGGYYIYLDQKIGKELEDWNIYGEGDVYSLFYSYKLFDFDNLSVEIDPGFELKNIKNKVRNRVTSEDRIRIAKLGLNLDFTDPLGGRSIITHEFDIGIAEFLDGLEESDDPGSSRSVAGGEFLRTVTNAARIQPLPYSLSFMLRGAMQLTADDMVASEQFHIGGMNTVRGYTVAEEAGDRGGTLSAELYVPPYFIPKDKKIPYTGTTYFDALRFMLFFDCGYVQNKNPLPGERKDKALFSFGPAIRFEVPEKLSVSFDYGFCIGPDASDGTDSEGYIEVKTYF